MEQKSKIICVRLSEEDYNGLVKYCTRYRIKLSKLVQKLIFNFLK